MAAGNQKSPRECKRPCRHPRASRRRQVPGSSHHERAQRRSPTPPRSRAGHARKARQTSHHHDRQTPERVDEEALAILIANELRTLRLASQPNRGLRPHLSQIAADESAASSAPTHGIIMLSYVRRPSLMRSPAALLATGIRRGRKPASACGHLTQRH